MVAWRAVLEAEAHDTPEIATASPDALDQETIEKWLVEAIGDGRGLVLRDAERALFLARCAENALKRFWRDERRSCCKRLWARLESELDAVERAIVAGLRDGKAQKAIAQALGISPSAVSQRLRTICKKAERIRGRLGFDR